MGDQATRLTLRMQRELKMLFSDPPPGVSLTHPSPRSTTNAVSPIEAQLEGPQGSAYREGVFRVKIQIPDRYPFHPPIVTFKTPIYHPNIDEGGRICLDILSLPPKGAWQPSLNISTVLMSIGLLLSEPNPDDGLAHEASREYKYNRQAFDQKARSWTEKYAKTTKICGTAEANDNLPGDPVPCLVQGGMEEADGIPINMPQEIDGTKNLYKNSHGSIPDSSSSVFTTGDRKELETAGLRCHRQRCLSLSQSEGGLSIKHVHKEKIQEVECHQNQDLGNRRLKLSLSLSRNEIGSSKSVLGKPESKNAFSENQMQVQLSCEDAKMGVPIRKIEKIDGLKLPSPSSSRQSKKRGQLYSMAIVPDSDSDEEQNVKPPAKLRLSLNRGK